jgi:predicted dehydrogenase
MNSHPSSVSRTLRVGLVGYGFAGQTFHAPVIAGVPGLHLAAVASSQAERVRADWPDAAVCATPAALFARSDIDLVVLATPNDTHHPLARQALESGKHVVIDKPFTTQPAQARALDALAAATGLLLSVYQNRRFDADYLTLRALLDQGALGRPVFFESHFDRYRPQVRQRWREMPGEGAGLWLDLGSHLVDQTVQLFGWPSAIQADLAALRDGALTEDYFHVQLRYDRGPHAGLRAVLHASTLAAAPAPRYRVHGTSGSYVKQGVDPQEDALRAGARPRLEALGDWGLDADDGELSSSPDGVAIERRPVATQRGNYLAYYAAVRDAILGLGPNPVTPSQAVGVMDLLALGQQSAREARELAVPQPR